MRSTAACSRKDVSAETSRHAGFSPFAYPLSAEALDDSDREHVMVGADSHPTNPDRFFAGELQLAYVHEGHLGTPQVITESGGIVLWQADYRPFGEVEVTTSLVDNDLRFPGQLFDGESGLHYNYFRNPAVIRRLDTDGLRPSCTRRPTARLSHLDCRAVLTLIVAMQMSYAGGMDAVQALQLAMNKIGTDLAHLAKTQGVLIAWLPDRLGDTGFSS